jgi:hypothetical protein
MTEWESYRLSDFLLFSPRTYWRLFELYNDSLWPLPLLTLAAGFLAGGLALLRPRAAAHAVPILLAILWTWIAWSFFWTRYATINWAAAYVAPLFGLQAALLLVIGAASRWEFDARGPRRLAGIAPDPTAIGTLALLLLVRARWCATLFSIPILWCVASGVTQWAMESAVAWLPPAAALAAAALAVVQPHNTVRA